MKKQIMTILAVGVSATMFSGCLSPKGKTVFEKRAYVQKMRSDALKDLFRLDPAMQGEIANAPGYAVFDAIQTQFLITSTGNGYGIAKDNRTGRDTYMSAFGLGAGFGLGIKGHRMIAIFKDREVMREFVEEGWVFGTTGAADAKVDEEGGSATGTAAFDSRIKIVTITDTGLMLAANVRGGKVWKDKELN